MPDYKLKSKVIDSPILEDYKKWSKNEYLYTYTDKDISLKQLNVLREIASYHIKNNPIEWKECSRISHAHCCRVTRLKKRITDMITSGDCIFLTMTFTDKTLSKISPKNRRKNISSFLSSLNSVDYVANIDFGKKNHREHYHAVVQIDHIDYSQYKLGAINGIKIRNQTDDLERISRYIAKLTNHAIKETTKRSVLIYKRKKRSSTV